MDVWQRIQDELTAVVDRVAEAVRTALASAQVEGGAQGLELILDSADRGLHACGWESLQRDGRYVYSPSVLGRPGEAICMVGAATNLGVQVRLYIMLARPVAAVRVIYDDEYTVEIPLTQKLWRQIREVL